MEINTENHMQYIKNNEKELKEKGYLVIKIKEEFLKKKEKIEFPAECNLIELEEKDEFYILKKKTINYSENKEGFFYFEFINNMEILEENSTFNLRNFKNKLNLIDEEMEGINIPQVFAGKKILLKKEREFLQSTVKITFLVVL
jgi:hypothetical protein